MENQQFEVVCPCRVCGHDVLKKVGAKGRTPELHAKCAEFSKFIAAAERAAEWIAFKSEDDKRKAIGMVMTLRTTMFNADNVCPEGEYAPQKTEDLDLPFE